MNCLLKTAFLALLIFSISGCGSLVHYKVQEGDTLYSIGWRYDQDAKKIAEWNELRTPYVIHQGQMLRIAPPVGAPAEPLFTLSHTKKASAQRSTKLAQSSPVSKSPVSQNRGPITWHWPAEGKLISTFSSRKIDRKGINISARKGSAIRAAALGKVVYSGSGLASYGNLLIIKHNESYLSAYAHNDQLLVKEGDSVSKGQRVATMGATGSDKVMLHFEVRYKGNPVDPLQYLPRR